MKKRPTPAITPTAFSIARQFTGPPFSVTLENAELRRHLAEEMAHPLTPGKVVTKRPKKKSKR